MPRIATRFHGPAFLTTTATTKLTVSASEKAIIRHIHVENPSAGAVPFTMSIGADTTATRIFDAYSIGANQILDHMCLYVLDAAEIIQAFAGTANILTLTINGERSVLG
jgi:hypothetical protein